MNALNPIERKNQLVLDCAADRAAWVRACRRPETGPVAAITSKVLNWTNTLSAFVPGRFGRLLRGATFFASFARSFVLAQR